MLGARYASAHDRVVPPPQRIVTADQRVTTGAQTANPSHSNRAIWREPRRDRSQRAKPAIGGKETAPRTSPTSAPTWGGMQEAAGKDRSQRPGGARRRAPVCR
jgi:hypothetical protein